MATMDDWPEPTVRVQELSLAGLTAIPERYVKPLSQRPTAEKVSLTNIPVVDMSDLLSINKASTINKISEACREWGIFHMVNHGVSDELLKKIREAWRGFFQLPLDLKQTYSNSPKTYEGYGSRVGVQKGATLDWGDYYYLFLAPPQQKNYEKWPASPRSVREVTEEYGKVLMKLCINLLKILATCLGIEEEYLVHAFGGTDIGASIRVNFFPKCPQPDLTLGLSPHSDPGAITVLLPDHKVNGLQVRRDDSWIEVQSPSSSLTVIMGDQMQIISNGKLKSVEHRVVVNSTTERVSFAFFCLPKGDIPIEPAPELVTPKEPAIYRPMTFNEYRVNIRIKGPNGKGSLLQVSSEKESS